jgi:hypothetical protein
MAPFRHPELRERHFFTQFRAKMANYAKKMPSPPKKQASYLKSFSDASISQITQIFSELSPQYCTQYIV